MSDRSVKLDEIKVNTGQEDPDFSCRTCGIEKH